MVFAFLEMLPRLSAEDELMAMRTTRNAMAEQMDEHLLDTLERRAAGDIAPRRAKKATHADLAAMGIGVVSVPPEGALSDG
jgi:hypothetical protein